MAGSSRIALPHTEVGALRTFARRIGLAIALILFVAIVAYIGRDGYADADEDPITIIDAVYYASVSVTTTGYGDIRPESQTARLITTLLVTPARILFLILLVGTTVEILAERTRAAFEERRWRRKLHGHTIICGFGTKGRSAARTLLDDSDAPAGEIVVIESSPEGLKAAAAMKLAAVVGDATERDVLRDAGIEDAAAVIVAPARDDTAVLITLTARQLNPTATITAAVREEQNADLLRQSGADTVITSSEAAGRLLGLATHQPHQVRVLEELLEVGHGLELTEQVVDAPGTLRELTGDLVLGVVRAGKFHRYDDPAVADVEPGDRLLCVCSSSSGPSERRRAD